MTLTTPIDPPLDYREEIDRLYDVEYGNRLDAGFRLVAVAMLGVVIFFYTGLFSGLIWAAGYLLAQTVNYYTLRSRPPRCTLHDVALAGAAFCIVTAAFLWLPATFLYSDDPALRIGGAAAFGAVLVFLIHRSDRVLAVMIGEIAVVGLAALWVTVQTMLQVPALDAQLGVVASVSALMIYFTITMLTHRRLRIEAEEATRRSSQAQKMEAIGQLAGGVAHDFNNLLTAIIGNLDLYGVLETPAERSKCIGEARVAAERAADLVSQLLTFARRSTMQIAPHEVGRLLTQLQILTRRLLPASIIQGFAPPQAPLFVAVDQSQFIAALINLVINARDAMPDGGVLRITAEPLELTEPFTKHGGSVLPPGRYVALGVIDSGKGIAPDILHRVTEPFFTTKGVGQGSGLGLSMVDGFTRQSGGALSIASSPDGTKVKLFLPLVPPPADLPL